MARLAFAIAMLAVLGANAAARAEARDWTGTYSYTESGGRTAGGTGIVVSHEIVVRLRGSQYQAEITANGYQTQVQLLALCTVSGSKLQIRFEKDGEEQMFKGRYQPGALLLELERSGARLLTHWGAYTPATTERFRNPGVYFKRQ